MLFILMLQQALEVTGTWWKQLAHTSSPIFSVSSAGKSLEAKALRIMVENSFKSKKSHIYYMVKHGNTQLKLTDNEGSEG